VLSFSWWNFQQQVSQGGKGNVIFGGEEFRIVISDETAYSAAVCYVCQTRGLDEKV
jgi:hypothetical protein